MIKKVWAKFDGIDIACVCEEHKRKCEDDMCKEYVVKFIEINRDDDVKKVIDDVRHESNNLQRNIKKFQSEIGKSIRKFKI